MKLKCFKFIKKADLFFKKNSPTILTSIGVAGMVGTIVLAVKATPKALQLKEELGENATRMDIVKAVAPVYLPSAVVGSTSILCIFCANSIYAKRSAALAAAYKLTETAYRDYKEKVIETIGEKKEKQIKDKIAKDILDKNPLNEVIEIKDNKTLCYDIVSGRYFESDIETIRQVVNKLNHDLNVDGYVSLNDFHYALGMSPTKLGDILGWHVDFGLIEVSFSTQLSSDDRPCLVIEYTIAPGYGFDEMYCCKS